MARYSVDITANIKGFDELDAIERQIKNIQGYAKKPIDINVKVDSKNDDISKQMMSAGKSAATAFAKGFSSSDNLSIDAFTKFKQKSLDELNKLQSQIAKITGSGFEKAVVDEKAINKWANEYISTQKKAFNKIEKEAVKQQKNLNKIRERESASYANPYTDAYQSIGKQSNVQREMSEYYSRLEKEAIKQQQNFEKRQKEIYDSLNNYKYDSNISKMNRQLSGFSKDSESYSKANKALQDYKSTVESLRNHFDKNNSFTLDADGLEKEFINLSNASEKFKNSLSMLKDEGTKSLGTLESSILGNKISKYIQDNTKLTKEYEDAFRRLESQARSGIDVSKEFRELQGRASADGVTGKSKRDEIKRAFGQIAEFTGIYGALQNVIYEVPRQMIKAVRDVNAAQIELTKVTTASQPELNAYWDEAAESAKRYGSTISDVIKSTADWSRLGYSLDEAKKLSDVTTLLTKVGDDMTQESASQGLISTLKGFQMQADQAESIVDKVNEVANTQPIDTAGIFSGLERSASSMSAANNTLEETIALITAANSVVQDADVVGE